MMSGDRVSKIIIFFMIISLISICLITGCFKYKTREDSIPDDAVKMNPESDNFPPKLHSDEYENPIPMSGPINTAGAEDSPFIPCCSDRDIFYFFFTPDVKVPIEDQIIDGVTGIYVSEKIDGEWNEPKRVKLQDTWKVSLDGCTFVYEDIMWFCSARQGYTGLHWFTAEYIDGEWVHIDDDDISIEERFYGIRVFESRDLRRAFLFMRLFDRFPLLEVFLRAMNLLR